MPKQITKLTTRWKCGCGVRRPKASWINQEATWADHSSRFVLQTTRPRQEVYLWLLRTAGPHLKRAMHVRSAVVRHGQDEWSVAFYTWDAEIAQQRWNCGTASALPQRGLLWFSHAARRPDDELSRGLLLPTPPHPWRGRTGNQLRTWATTTRADLEPLSVSRVFGYIRRRKDWVKSPSEPAQGSRAWGGQLDWLCRLNSPRVNAATCK